MPNIDSVDVGGIIVALIAAFVSWSTHRTATRANKLNTDTTSRVDMEKEAYQRARQLDTGTIERQDEELRELREELKALRRRVQRLEDENRKLKVLVPLDMHPQLDHGEGDN